MKTHPKPPTTQGPTRIRGKKQGPILHHPQARRPGVHRTCVQQPTTTASSTHSRCTALGYNFHTQHQAHAHNPGSKTQANHQKALAHQERGSWTFKAPIILALYVDRGDPATLIATTEAAKALSVAHVYTLHALRDKVIRDMSGPLCCPVLQMPRCTQPRARWMHPTAAHGQPV